MKTINIEKAIETLNIHQFEVEYVHNEFGIDNKRAEEIVDILEEFESVNKELLSIKWRVGHRIETVLEMVMKHAKTDAEAIFIYTMLISSHVNDREASERKVEDLLDEAKKDWSKKLKK